MKKIEDLILKIEAELEDAEKYADDAYIIRRENKALSDLEADLARDEMKHATRLFNHALKCANEVIQEGGTEAKAVKKMWDNAYGVYNEWTDRITNTLNSL